MTEETWNRNKIKTNGRRNLKKKQGKDRPWLKELERGGVEPSVCHGLVITRIDEEIEERLAERTHMGHLYP